MVLLGWVRSVCTSWRAEVLLVKEVGRKIALVRSGIAALKGRCVLVRMRAVGLKRYFCIKFLVRMVFW